MFIRYGGRYSIFPFFFFFSDDVKAEVLGQKIAIMAAGKLRAVGNSLHLKSRFGVGYRLNLITDEANIPQVKELISKMVPQAVLREENAGSLIYSLADLESKEVGDLFNYLQQNLSQVICLFLFECSKLVHIVLKDSGA